MANIKKEVPKAQEVIQALLCHLGTYGINAEKVAKNVLEKLREKNTKREAKGREIVKLPSKALVREVALSVFDKSMEFVHAGLMGYELDKMSNDPKASGVLKEILQADFGLFGGDEVYMLGTVELAGPSALMFFSHYDKFKTGFAKDLDNKSKDPRAKVFLDDFFSGWVAMTEAYLESRRINEDTTVKLADEKKKQQIKEYLTKHNKGVDFIAKVTYDDQVRYTPEMTLNYAVESVEATLLKRNLNRNLFHIIRKQEEFGTEEVDLDTLSVADRYDFVADLIDMVDSGTKKYGFIAKTNALSELQLMIDEGTVHFPQLVAQAISACARARVAFKFSLK